MTAAQRLTDEAEAKGRAEGEAKGKAELRVVGNPISAGSAESDKVITDNNPSLMHEAPSPSVLPPSSTVQKDVRFRAAQTSV